MLKRLISICLCTFMLCTMIFVPSVSATGTTPNEVTNAVFTDELENMNYIYSYPNKADNWHLELFTQFYRENNDGNAITGVGYRCGQEGVKGWAISDASVIWYKAGEVNGFDKKFTKAEFTVWMHGDTFDDKTRRPVIKVKSSANGTATVLPDVTWEKVTHQTAGTDWNCEIKAVVTIPQGTEFIGLGFNNSDTSFTGSITDRYFMFDKVVLYTGAEAVKYYNNGSTLEDAWSYTNLTVKDDWKEQTIIVDTSTGETKTDIANYNNGGKMIGMEKNGAVDVVYKVPEGRSFKSFFTEISVQNTGIENVKLAYSEDGITYTDYTDSWTQGGRPGSFADASWAWIYSITVNAPENTNVKYIKLYHGADGLNQTNKFILRKASMLTEGGGNVVTGNVTDSMSGADNVHYDMSNFMSYNVYRSKEASQIANDMDIFKDSDLLVVNDLTKDAYITYKAADGKVFTSVQADQLVRDNGANNVDIKIYASTDGDEYVELTPNKTNNKYIHSTQDSTQPDACYNVHIALKSNMDRMTGYKYIKLEQPKNAVAHPEKGPNANIFKLARATLTTATAPESTKVAPGFAESFVDTENLCGLYGIFASAAESRFRPTDEAVGAGKTEPVYAMYQIADGKSFGYVKAIFKQTDINSKDNVAVYALDENKEVIEWDNSALWSVYSHKSGNNTANEHIFKGEVPANAKYLKLQMNYLADDWRCVISCFEIYGTFEGKVYSVDGETETDLNGTLTAGDIKGKVTFENHDSGSKTIYAIAALKDGDTVTKAVVKTHTLNKTGVVTLDTNVIEGCEVGEDTTFEIFLFDVTGGALTPILPQKIGF